MKTDLGLQSKEQSESLAWEVRLQWPRSNISQNRAKDASFPIQRTGPGPLWKAERQLWSPSLSYEPSLVPGQPGSCRGAWHLSYSWWLLGGQTDPSQLESGVLGARVVKGILRISPLCSKQQGKTGWQEGGTWNRRMQNLALTSAGPSLRNTRPGPGPRAELFSVMVFAWWVLIGSAPWGFGAEWYKSTWNSC